MTSDADFLRTLTYAVRVAALWLFFRSLPSLGVAPQAWSEGYGEFTGVVSASIIAVILWLSAVAVARWMLQRTSVSASPGPGERTFQSVVALLGLVQLAILLPRLVHTIALMVKLPQELLVRWGTTGLRGPFVTEILGVVLSAVCLSAPRLISGLATGLVRASSRTARGEDGSS